jgi:hypothetical protein
MKERQRDRDIYIDILTHKEIKRIEASPWAVSSSSSNTPNTYR